MSDINPLIREESVPDDNDRALRPSDIERGKSAFWEFSKRGIGEETGTTRRASN